MLVECLACRGSGQAQYGDIDEAVCPVCFGSRFIDPEKICKCGRPATWATSRGIFYCGRLSCNPEVVKISVIHPACAY